jgi:hypothetical protein
MKATISPMMHEIGRPVRGRPSYAWVRRWIVTTPDGGKLAPPMTLAEAKAFCRSNGWTFTTTLDLISY